MTASYTQFWRADDGTVTVSCTRDGDMLLWNQEQIQKLMAAGASSAPSNQTFTCRKSEKGFLWSPEGQMLPDGPKCITPCESGYRSNLEAGELNACFKFIPNSEASNLQMAWEVCQREDASLANPFTTDNTLEAFRAVASDQKVFTSVDRRNQNGILSSGLVNPSLIPAAVVSTSSDCVFFSGDEFVSHQCFPKEAIETTGVVCQKPRVCPESFQSHPVWGCYTSVVRTSATPEMTPLEANEKCALKYGSSLPPHTDAGGVKGIMSYISTVNRRGDGVTWRDADGTAVFPQLENANELDKHCLLVNPAAPDSFQAVDCKTPLETGRNAPTIICVYPRLTDCYSDPPGAPTDSRALNHQADATCPKGLVFNETREASASVTCHGALGNWLPAELSECVSACGSPPAAPEHSAMRPAEASNQTWYTYTCDEGLRTADGAPETTITCLSSGEYEPPQPAKCSQCAGFPALDETLVLDPAVDSGTLEQTVVVQCAYNMSTADGRSSQNVTCGPTGWTPTELSPCDVCTNAPMVDNTTVTVEMPESQSLGSVILYRCPSGKAFGFGGNMTSAICLPEGWFSCHQELSCSMCVDEPPAALANMNRSWSEFDQTANYTCNGLLTMDGDNNTQELGCGMDGWETTLLPCDKCETPEATHPRFSVSWDGVQLDNSTLTYTCPKGKTHQNMSSKQRFPCTVDGWQNEDPLPCNWCMAPAARPESNASPASTDAGIKEEETMMFNCNEGLVTSEGQANFTETCQRDGWTFTGNCTHCAGEPPAQNRSISRDWADDDTELGSVVTYNCSDGSQWTVTCGASGWSRTADPCDLVAMQCAAPRVAEYNNTEPDDTGKGTEPNRTATYRCLNGITTVLRCLEDGTWSTDQTPCAVPHNTCPTPPAAAGNATVEDSGPYTSGQRNVTYTCPDGTRAVLYCQNAAWTPGVVPCEEGSPPAPPPPPPGVFVTDTGFVADANGTATRTLTYDCDSGVRTLTWSDGAWRPENAVPCADLSNACPERNTSLTNVSFVDTGPYTDGVRSAIYNCSGAGLANTFTCVNASWSPDLVPCDVVPTPAPTDEVTMVTKATYDDKYPVTTNYYWASLDVNMTSTEGDDTWRTGQGPAGFESSLVLERGCMSHQSWPSRRDDCARNPADCEQGFSFSMWFRIEVDPVDAMFNSSAITHKGRRYLISTGGDDRGSPGVAVYIEGHELHALVSTGAQYWDVPVKGQLSSLTWTNIGVRWSKETPFGLPNSSQKLPGLQLFINNEQRARVAGPSLAKAAAQKPLEPAEVMIGCHRTRENPTYRDTCRGEFDEVAMWTRLLPSNESIYFLGGYDEQDQKTTVTTLLDEIKRCPKCFTDANMFRAAVDRAKKAIKTPVPTSAPVSSTAEASAAEEAAAAAEAAIDTSEGSQLTTPQELNKVKSLVELVEVMTKETKDTVTPKELGLFLSLHGVVGTALDAKTLNQWRGIEYAYKEKGGAASVVTEFERWVLELGGNTDVGGVGGNIVQSKTADNIEMELQTTYVFQLRQKPILSYPEGKKGLNTVQFASELFHKKDFPQCRFLRASVLYVYYPTLGHISPRRYSTLDVKANTSDLKLEGGVVSTKFALSSDDPALVANCTPTAEQLRTYPITTAISHTNPVKARRSPLFHQEEIDTGVWRRACVRWNRAISDYGGWDTEGCKAVGYSDFHTKCACAHFGQIAVMVQMEPPKIVDLEFEWLKIIKYICYTISALLLIAFIVAVIKIKALHEMFHLMRLNTALGMLVGSLLMVLTDIPEIRADRHTCTGFAGGIHFFYLLAATMVMLEGVADFRSVTSGAIGGKLNSYVAFAWGVPFLSLGYAMLMHLPDYGTDPRCMLGWPDQVKLSMFLPLMVLLAFTFLMTCLVSCNMQASRLRKENIVTEQLTVCKGYVFFSFYFFCTWIVGLIAYMRLGLKIPSFYPLFQILNSIGGIIFFLFCGIGSERFWLLIAGKSALRKKMLFSYTVTEQLSESQQNLVEKEPSRPATPEEEGEEFDPEAVGPRGPIVA